MSETTNAENTRRASWANQENQRRQAGFQKSTAAWSQDARMLDWMLATAKSGGGHSHGEAGVGFTPKRGEKLLATFRGCKLVEPKRGVGSYVGGYSGFSFRVSRGIRYNIGGSRGTFVPGVEQLQITDEGDAVVTNKRIAFQGGLNSREWAFTKLIAIRHDPSRPISHIHVSNRQKVSALAYPAEQASYFRFFSELGAAQEAGTAAALIAAIAAERAQLDRLRPAPPAVASPADAPTRGAAIVSGLTAIMTGKPHHSRRRRGVHTLVAGGVALMLLSMGVNSIASPLNGSTAHVGSLPSASTIPASTHPASPETATSPPTQTATPSPTQTTTPSPTQTATPPPAETAPPIGDAPVGKFNAGPKPKPPKMLRTSASKVRVGATCHDGSHSDATGRGACSWHGGVRVWLYAMPAWVAVNKAKNAAKKKSYKVALKKWTAATKKNSLLAKYPCSKGPYPQTSPGYADWRDSNHNGIACDR